MALTWSIEKCNLDSDFRERNWPAIEAMIWLTMQIKLGLITDKNLDEVEYRLRMIAKTTTQEVDAIIAILPKLVGLSTNVFDESRAKFHTHIIKNLEYDVNYDMRMSKKNKDEVSQ